MAQEYYSFMMNRFFETLFIQLMASIHGMIWPRLERGSSDNLFCSVYVVPTLFLDHFDSMFPKSERYSEV